MAFYDVQCQSCGHEFEAEAPMKDGPPKACPQPKCKGELQVVFNKPPTYHNRMSFMHPRKNRGRGY